VLVGAGGDIGSSELHAAVTPRIVPPSRERITARSSLLVAANVSNPPCPAQSELP
jgi:hypothetical protein